MKRRIEISAKKVYAESMSIAELLHQLAAFLYVDAVAPTNNLAERELRPAVIIRKTNGCNRSFKGANTHAVLSSVIRTAHKHDSTTGTHVHTEHATRNTQHLLPIPYLLPPITNYQLPITNYQLPITNYHLPTPPSHVIITPWMILLPPAPAAA